MTGDRNQASAAILAAAERHPGVRADVRLRYMTYLSLIVLIPIALLILRTTQLPWEEYWAIASSERVVAALRLSFGAACLSRPPSTWCSVSSSPGCWCAIDFPGKRLVDAIVDLPFALPTAVAGIALTAIFAKNGWVGQFIEPLRHQGCLHSLGVVVALTFIGLPFVVRTLQPVILEIERETEEAAATLGAGRRQAIFARRSADACSGAAYRLCAGAWRAASANTARSFSSPAICRTAPEIAPLLIVIRLDRIRLQRRHRNRHHHAGNFLRDVPRHQSDPAIRN